ncbi:putative cell surface glycoprotein [Haloferax mucosum ATCC BAA-1512]|uniref:Putative cell surface glycoprotein n=2 Tax=Haloferax mucosum TaxID=403181 RepID=M0IMI1_9EURY|nr:putative cell surface glycoprotein [Haloferax mucosum ATCC BAA-1512]
MVCSVVGGSIAFTGGAIAAQPAGPDGIADAGTDAGALAPGDTAVVQTIEITDSDENDTNAVEVTGVTVTAAADNTASAADVSSVRILDADGDELASDTAADSLFGAGQTFDLSGVSVPDDGRTTLQISVTVADNVSETAVLGVSTKVNWTENGTAGQTAAVTDGATETLEASASGLTGNETAESGNETAESNNETSESGNETAESNNETAKPGNETAGAGDGSDGNATAHPDGQTTERPTVKNETTAAETNGTAQNASETATATLDESSAAPDLQIVRPANQTVVRSDGFLDVAYGYVANAPDDVTSARISLTDGAGASYNYSLGKTAYEAGAVETVSLDLDKPAGNLTDGAYYVDISVTNASGDTDTVRTTGPVVVVNDERPALENVTITSNRTDIPLDGSVNFSYDYGSAPNASSITVWVVESGDTANFTAGDRQNATYAAYEQSVDHGVVSDRTHTVGLAYRVPDNSNYSVFVGVTDATGRQSNVSEVGRIGVNTAKPSIDSVQAKAGSDIVTVRFSEPVVAGDGDADITRADFAFQDGNDAGASSISGVVAHSKDTVTLHLDANVTLGDLGRDAVSARSGQLVDTHEGGARAVGPIAVALADTIPPTPEAVNLTAINMSNVDSYDVVVHAPAHQTDVEVTLVGEGGNSVSTSNDAVTGKTVLTLNATTLQDGFTTVAVNLTDVAGNSRVTETFTQKDTVAPGLTVVSTNAGSDVVTVRYTEYINDTSASDFAFSNLTTEVNTTRTIEKTTLTLNETIPATAINNSNVTLSASGVTDPAGNPIHNESILVDIDDPTVSGVTAEPGDERIVLTFSELVTPGENDSFTVDDFGYTENNSSGVTAIEAVSQTGPQTVVLETNGELTPDDLEFDAVTVAADGVYDMAGRSANAATYTIGIESDLRVNVSGRTMTLTVVSPNDIENATNGMMVRETNRELDSLEQFELDERFETLVNASQFTKVKPGTYEATVTIPSDADGDADGRYSVAGPVGGTRLVEMSSVDTTDPHPTDAVLLDVTDAAQLDDTRNTTEIRVLFNEPINASDIMPSDVSIDGFDGEIVAVQDAGPFGSVTIITEGTVQTGDSPKVRIDGESYIDLAGTHGKQGGATTVHTAAFDLDEGRNFVSVPASSGDLPLDELDLSAVDAIYAYDASSGSWDAFDPDAWINDLTKLEGGNGYIFVMERDATLTLNVYNEPGATEDTRDVAPVPTQQRLTEGWNLVGHYQEYDQNVSVALSSLDDDSVYKLLAHDESADRLAYRSYNAGEFETMKRGEAYWVFVRDDEVYTEATNNTADS